MVGGGRGRRGVVEGGEGRKGVVEGGEGRKGVVEGGRGRKGVVEGGEGRREWWRVVDELHTMILRVSLSLQLSVVVETVSMS